MIEEREGGGKKKREVLRLTLRAEPRGGREREMVGKIEREI